MPATKESFPRVHQFAIGRQTGDNGSRIGILKRTASPLIHQTVYGLVENHGDIPFTFSVLLGVPAVGSVLFNAQPTDGQTITMDDGPNAAVTFEFDSNNSVVQTATLRQVVIGATIAETARNFAIAVNAAPALLITARLVPHNYQTPATVELTNDVPGTVGNIALGGTSTLTKTGMAGGTGGPHNIRVLAASVASVAVVPRARVEFVIESLISLDFITFDATGGDDVLGDLTLAYFSNELELRESYV